MADMEWVDPDDDDIDPAVEWLEIHWERNHPLRNPYNRDGTTIRPMFQILTDHAELISNHSTDTLDPDDHCWCAYEGELIVIEPEDREE